MNILYLSCHSILEYDEVKLFLEMGFNVRSHGAYIDQESQGDGLRPKIEMLSHDPSFLNSCRLVSKDNLTKEFIEPFDVIIIMSWMDWVEKNWDFMKGKRVIFRCIGQNNAGTEKRLKKYRDQGLQIVRYSPLEETLGEYAGSDALIRFYKDEAEYGNWNGDQSSAINFTQSMKTRMAQCNYEFFRALTEEFPCKLFGPHNENIGTDWAFGAQSFEVSKAHLRNNRAYIYTGTHPASYTLNFIEAWMTGIPMICVGPILGNDPNLKPSRLYEIPHLIQHGQNGFFTDDTLEASQILSDLMRDKDYANYISGQARLKAVDYFGKEKIKKQWLSFLLGEK